MIAEYAGRVWKAWQEFWFEARCDARFRVFRLTICALLFFFYLNVIPDIDFLYTDRGILRSSIMNDMLPMSGRFSLFNHLNGDAAIYALFSLMMVSLVVVALGVWPRFWAIVLYVLHLSFLHRNVTVVFGVDLISTFFLLYFCLAAVPRRGSARKRPEWALTLQSVAFRFAQIQLCIVYAYAGWEKVKGMSWWRGEAVWYALSNPQLARFDFTWAASWTVLLAFLTYSTLIWEIYFGVLVWVRPLRYWILGFGVLFHLGIALVMNLPFFSLVMISSYPLFLDEVDAARVEAWISRRLSWSGIRGFFAPKISSEA